MRNGARMKIAVFVGIACVIAQVTSQNYGPVPPRPQFVGASLVQGPRPNFRSRGPARAISLPEPVEQPQLIQRVRRPQVVARSRNQFVQPQTFDQQRSNVIDDIPPVQYKPQIALPTPVPLFQAAQPLQQTQPPKLLTPRPVIEDETNEASEEEAPTPVTTQNPTTPLVAAVRPTFQQSSPVLPPSPVTVAFQRPQFVQNNALRPQPVQPQPLGFPESASLPARQLIRTQVRPAISSSPLPSVRPIPQQILNPKEGSFEDNEPLYYRQQQGRPQKKQEPILRQQIVEPEQVRVKEPPRQISRQQAARQQDYQKPIQRQPHGKAPSQPREKKPVAQTIRKYHEEHEDGSITWGYENDDGSFKEETIGVDCVTRGKYGYYDPDGVKREYTYQTGIPCDKQQQEAEESRYEGFIDYTNNKYILPNGDEIDLEAMVKNRARKPVPQYRN